MIPNTKIREMVRTKSIHLRIQQQRIKGFGHLTRLPIQLPGQRAYNTRFSGRKARGRPWKTWTNAVNETLSLYNISPAQAFRHAADKYLVLPSTPHVVDKSKVSKWLPARLQTLPCPLSPSNVVEVGTQSSSAYSTTETDIWSQSWQSGLWAPGHFHSPVCHACQLPHIWEPDLLLLSSA